MRENESDAMFAIVHLLATFIASASFFIAFSSPAEGLVFIANIALMQVSARRTRNITIANFVMAVTAVGAGPRHGTSLAAGGFPPNKRGNGDDRCFGFGLCRRCAQLARAHCGDHARLETQPRLVGRRFPDHRCLVRPCLIFSFSEALQVLCPEASLTLVSLPDSGLSAHA